MKGNVTPIAPMALAEIARLLPHQYPLLLVDRVLEGETGSFLLGMKNVSGNEWFFHGIDSAFPMPRPFVLEALSQCCGLLAFQSGGAKGAQPVGYLAGISNAYFDRDVWPGDQLQLHVEIDRARRHIWRFNTEASVDGERVVAASIRCSISIL